MSVHPWDGLREMRTVIETVPSASRGVHESVTRSYQILECVKTMLDRGDSPETVREFIRWAETEPQGETEPQKAAAWRSK